MNVSAVRRGRSTRGIHRQIAGVLAAEGSFRGAVLDEIAGHPMIFAGAGEAFDRFSPIAAMQFSAAFAGRTNQHQAKRVSKAIVMSAALP